MPKTNFFNFTGSDGNTYTLSLKEKVFCEAYLRYMGNGTKSVIDAGYKVRNEGVAAAIANENLRKPHISQYIALLLDKGGFSEATVKAQHTFLLNQSTDLSVKAKAIDMFYKVSGLYAPFGRKHQYDAEFSDYADEEVEEVLAQKIANRVNEIKAEKVEKLQERLAILKDLKKLA